MTKAGRAIGRWASVNGFGTIPILLTLGYFSLVLQALVASAGSLQTAFQILAAINPINAILASAALWYTVLVPAMLNGRLYRRLRGNMSGFAWWSVWLLGGSFFSLTTPEIFSWVPTIFGVIMFLQMMIKRIAYKRIIPVLAGILCLLMTVIFVPALPQVEASNPKYSGLNLRLISQGDTIVVLDQENSSVIVENELAAR